jgi:hypothetical protein
LRQVAAAASGVAVAACRQIALGTGADGCKVGESAPYAIKFVHRSMAPNPDVKLLHFMVYLLQVGPLRRRGSRVRNTCEHGARLAMLHPWEAETSSASQSGKRQAVGFIIQRLPPALTHRSVLNVPIRECHFNVPTEISRNLHGKHRSMLTLR